jgi:hypothetical protein
MKNKIKVSLCSPPLTPTPALTPPGQRVSAFRGNEPPLPIVSWIRRSNSGENYFRWSSCGLSRRIASGSFCKPPLLHSVAHGHAKSRGRLRPCRSLFRSPPIRSSAAFPYPAQEQHRECQKRVTLYSEPNTSALSLTPLARPAWSFSKVAQPLTGTSALKSQISNMKLPFSRRLPKSKIENRKSKI